MPIAFQSSNVGGDGPDTGHRRRDNDWNARGRGRAALIAGVASDFPGVVVGSSSMTSFSFGLGGPGGDESFIRAYGPEFNLISGSPGVLCFDSVSCEQIGIGLDCMADVVFAPNAIGDLLSEFEISGTFEFEAIHGEDEGEIFEYGDAFRGTGIAVVPLPTAAAGQLATLGLLGWVGRARMVGGPGKGRP